MQWAPSRNGGFTTGEPWLPVGAETAVVNVEAQRDDPRSMLSLFRELIRLRRASPALRRGDWLPLASTPPDVFAWLRHEGHERWLVAVNFGPSNARLGLPPEGGPATLRLSSAPDRPVGSTVSSFLELGADEGVVVELGAAVGGA
jgi:alpha-glucosidase